ncbi:TetR/AcrR family transcriptional regulator [Streptomyces sp. AC602_WCS936]|uniref:TetR/AcrR family transcriptional regulator n=1 Tax=Streptomyces sp. AC602_WCS936 TaxID=2823685 RepID=UPI001C27FD74|nr:TetR/AcrR family transcriptional regulator [Streptomyces sp. AC602_WCS936]
MVPAARESLLNAAYLALERRPWSAVRMVDVAAAAGVSRQTLYNEFGSKEGLARALVRREADGYLAGVERALAGGGPGARRDRLTATAEWTVSVARDNALVRAMLTGCWSERLPAPPLTAVPSSSVVPAQRRADGPLPSPRDFVALVRDRAVAALNGDPSPDTVDLARSCELAVRLALSCVAAPPGSGGVAELVRTVLPRQLAS